MTANQTALLRQNRDGSQRVTHVELFFDLVFVFAVTQLSQLLLANQNLRGIAQTLLLMFAVWTAWIYTAWATNWFDPGRRAIRLMLVAVMLASLIMSAAVPQAFGDRGLVFAGAYVAMEVGRTIFAIQASGAEPGLRRNFQRILFWKLLPAPLWLAGGFAPGMARFTLWAAAVAVEYAGPAAGFSTPRLGRSRTSDWNISGTHLAERCQLFVIVALGESILVTGATFGGFHASAGRIAAFVVAFLGTVSLWWVYFDRAADESSNAVSQSEDPGRLGRSAYSYFHLPIVAGIIVSAVGDELTISHPDGHASRAVVATILSGPALFLAGHLAFKWAVFGVISVSRLAGLAALALLVPVGLVMPPLVLAAAAVSVVAGVATWDGLSRRHPGGSLIKPHRLP